MSDFKIRSLLYFFDGTFKTSLKLNTQLSFQALLPEEWRVWCVCLYFNTSRIVFGEERANLNTAVTLICSSSSGIHFRFAQEVRREYCSINKNFICFLLFFCVSFGR